MIKVNRRDQQAELGERSRSPRWAVAFKFAPREEVTEVMDIVVQVGRTGKLTPVALLRPVDVGGVTVGRATLHNQDEVDRKDVRVGDTVTIGELTGKVARIRIRATTIVDWDNKEIVVPNKNFITDLNVLQAPEETVAMTGDRKVTITVHSRHSLHAPGAAVQVELFGAVVNGNLDIH